MADICLSVEVSDDIAHEARTAAGAAAPVVKAESTVKGHVVLTPPEGGTKKGIASLHIVHKIATDSGAEMLGDSVQCLPPGDYAPSESIRVPFEVKLAKGPPSYEGDGKTVQHSLFVTAPAIGASRWSGSAGLELAQPIFVEAAAEAPSKTAAWLSVGDLGGEARLTVPTGPLLPLGSVTTAKVHVQGTTPLDKVLIKLLALEGKEGTAPRCVREVLVWCKDADGATSDKSRSDKTAALESDDGLSVPIDLTAGFAAPVIDLTESSSAAVAAASNDEASVEPVGPSFPPTKIGEEEVEVKHWLRLVLVPTGGQEAWNTLPVRVGLLERDSNGTPGACLGAPRGTLGPAPERKKKEAAGGGDGSIISKLKENWTTVAFVMLMIVPRILGQFMPQDGANGGGPAKAKMPRGGGQYFEQQAQGGFGGGGRAGFGGGQGFPGFNNPLRGQGGGDYEDDEVLDDAAEVWVEGKGWVKA